MGGCRKVHNKSLHILYYSPKNQGEWVGHAAHGRDERAYIVFAGKPERKRLYG
jgi:hypothetical protein